MFIFSFHRRIKNEKEIRKLMYMCLGALIALGGYFFGTLHNDIADAQLTPTNVEYNEIRCQKLTIVDANGNTLLDLGSNTLGDSGRVSVFGGGDVSIYEGNGELRARLGIVDARYSRQTDDGSWEPIRSGHMSIHGADGKILASLGSGLRGGDVTIRGQNGKILASLNGDVRGGTVNIHDRIGESRLQLSVTDQGGGVVRVNHGGWQSNNKVVLHAIPRGGVVTVIGNDRRAVRLNIDDYGGGMAIFSKSGKNVLQTSVNNMGGGFISVWDQFGDIMGGFPKGKSGIQKQQW